MTSFENFFNALKTALMKPKLYDIWPDFEPVYDENEYSWTTLRKRSGIASKAYSTSTGKDMEKWPTVMLCRIHSPN